MDAQFPSNSRNHKPTQKRPEIPEERPVLESVMEPGERVIRRKKPLGRRLYENFFAGDGVLRYVAERVILPAIQELFLDTVQQMTERAIYGDRAPSRPRYHGGIRSTGPHFSYNRPTTVVSSTQPSPAQRRPVVQASSMDVGEIIVPDKIRAEIITERMFEIMEQYGSVTVANLNEALQLTSTPTDYRWGWTDLQQLRIRRHPQGWSMLFPPPEDLR